MGHLVNPIAYRLGHSRSWEDSWYIKHIYYPEFLHSMLKIRYYIYYFWTTRYMEKKGILFSHLYIYKFFKNFLVKIFLYNTDLEKNTYSFYARGVGIFSDSFYYRLKKKKKKKEPYSYDRYKPDLFFSLFLYYAYFSKVKIERKKQEKLNFKSLFLKKNIKKNKKSSKFISVENYHKKRILDLNISYFNKLKDGNLEFFFNDFKIAKESKNFLKMYSYEKKIKNLNSKKLNLGFLDFFLYVFFKINMMYKREDDILKGKKKRKSLEMVLNYQTKINKSIILLKKFLKLKLRFGAKKMQRRSLKNLIFFLTFLMKFFYRIKNRSRRSIFKLRDLNIKLVRMFVFNKLLANFAFFYGKFLNHIISILNGHIKNTFFKFCYITNNSINAKFITRYIGLKLKKKFPLFYVINPLKKEFRKLAFKKKRKKFNSSPIYKSKYAKMLMNYKKGFQSVLNALYRAYLVEYLLFYKKFRTYVTYDMCIYILSLKCKYKAFLIVWRKKLKMFFRNRIWKKYKKRIIINKKWIKLLDLLLKFFKKKNKLLKFLKVFSKMKKYINNKFIINLFFSSNKNHVSTLVFLCADSGWNMDIFNFLNKSYLNHLIHDFINNYNLLNYNSASKTNIKILTLSTYFLKSYMIYLNIRYSFTSFNNFLNENKKKNYYKRRHLHKPTSLILGYKMSFKGRFTRKQRASSVWFHQGLVPLNTFKGFIDYSFFTIPLKNSAISIKLWLYKNKNWVIWDFSSVSEKI